MLLKQSTAVTVPFGPFVDGADGVTLVTGLAGALDSTSAGIKISKNGGTLVVRSTTITASSYDSYGTYKVSLSSGDTATLGQLYVIYVSSSACLPVWKDCLVVASQVYDDTLNGAADPWTTAMTESYSADGGTFTPAQALYQINQMLQEKSISGTTLTVKKVDGTTTAMTFTLSSSSAPTSITRAS